MEEKEPQQWPGPTTPPADDESATEDSTTKPDEDRDWPGPTTPDPGQGEGEPA